MTGCAGFIGSHLTEALLADGVDVVGVDCFNDNYGRSQKLRQLERARQWSNFDFVPIDLARGDLAEIVSGSDVIYHLAAEPGVRSSWGARFANYVQNNVVATQHMLEAAASVAGSSRFVFASSSSIYGEAETLPTPEDTIPAPLSPYGTTKLSGEHLCRAYHVNWGVQTVALRFFSVFGPRQRPDMAFTRFCLAAARNEPIEIYGDGNQTRDFTFVADIVRAVRAAAVAPQAAGRVYNIGGGMRRSVNDALEKIEEFAGRPLDVQRLAKEKGDVRDTAADTTRARDELLWTPEAEWEESLRAQFDWAANETRSTQSVTAA